MNPRGSSARAHHLRLECSGIVVVHFSPSRTSRPVVCRSTAREGACRVASRARGRPSVAWPAARRYSHGIGPQPIHFFECVCVRPAASSVSSYPEARTWCRPRAWPAVSRRCPWTGQDSNYRSATLLLWVLSGPVLKHGPRSLTCARVIGMQKPKGEMKVKIGLCADRGRMGRVTYAAPHSRGVSFSLREEAHLERTRWDPKDGELCLVRTKSGETLMEVRSDSDVQIDRRNWV